MRGNINFKLIQRVLSDLEEGKIGKDDPYLYAIKCLRTGLMNITYTLAVRDGLLAIKEDLLNSQVVVSVPSVPKERKEKNNQKKREGSIKWPLLIFWIISFCIWIIFFSTTPQSRIYLFFLFFSLPAFFIFLFLVIVAFKGYCIMLDQIDKNSYPQ